MTTPKQRLINIMQEQLVSSLDTTMEYLFIRDDKKEEFKNLLLESSVTAEIVTNTYILNMNDEELEEYVSAVETVTKYHNKLGDTIQTTNHKVMQGFIEDNIDKIQEMQIEFDDNCLEDIE